MIYDWGFKIKTLPEPPSGHGRNSPAPGIEQLAQAPARRADYYRNGEFAKWLWQLDRIDNQLASAVKTAIQNGYLNLQMQPWPRAIETMGSEPPSTTTPLIAYARWDSLFTVRNEGASFRRSESITRGSTTETSERKEFGLKVGINASLGYASTSIGMSAEFSAAIGRTVTITYSESQTVTNEFLIPEQTTCQVWQLILYIDAQGIKLNERRPIFLNLTYPANSMRLIEEFEDQEMNRLLGMEYKTQEG